MLWTPGNYLSVPEKTVVANIRDVDARWLKESHYVYIGRNWNGLKSQGWGNPFHLIHPWSDAERNHCLEQYKKWFFSPEREKLREKALRELQQKVLVCFCHPKACHGHVLADWVNGHGG